MVLQDIEFDRSLLGVEFPAGTFRVTRERLQRYCRIVGETSPIFTQESAARAAGYRGLVVPLPLCGLMGWVSAIPDVKLKVRGTTFLATQTLEALAPICVDDAVVVTVRLQEVYVKTGRSGTMLFVVWAYTFNNQVGQAVAKVQRSFATVLGQ